MKAFLILILSCASIFAADPSIQVVSIVKTNGEAVFTLDTFTRNGETNLVRSVLTRAGVVESQYHKFYHSGVLVGEHWNYPDSCGFMTEANLPYSLIFKASPSNHVSSAFICTEDRIVLDYFMATNGAFYPVDTSAVQAARRMTTEMQKAVSPATQ